MSKEQQKDIETAYKAVVKAKKREQKAIEAVTDASYKWGKVTRSYCKNKTTNADYKIEKAKKHHDKVTRKLDVVISEHNAARDLLLSKEDTIREGDNFFTRVVKKRQEENEGNSQPYAKAFEYYKGKKLKEKEYLSRLAAELVEAKEERQAQRQHARDLERDKRHHEYAKALDREHEKNKYISKRREEERKLIIDSFADKGDALKYVSDPEEMEKHRYTEDASSLKDWLWGHIKQRFTGEKYTPKKVRSVLR
jgi:hypothetical protein